MINILETHQGGATNISSYFIYFPILDSTSEASKQHSFCDTDIIIYEVHSCMPAFKQKKKGEIIPMLFSCFHILSSISERITFLVAQSHSNVITFKSSLHLLSKALYTNEVKKESKIRKQRNRGKACRRSYWLAPSIK